MTLSDIHRIADLFAAAGRRCVPVPISEWREYMATKSVGKVSKKALAKGKIQPIVKQSVSRKIASKKKADRTAKGLKANRARAAK